MSASLRRAWGPAARDVTNSFSSSTPGAHLLPMYVGRCSLGFLFWVVCICTLHRSNVRKKIRSIVIHFLLAGSVTVTVLVSLPSCGSGTPRASFGTNLVNCTVLLVDSGTNTVSAEPALRVRYVHFAVTQPVSMPKRYMPPPPWRSGTGTTGQRSLTTAELSMGATLASGARPATFLVSTQVQ